jgi:Zn finger protein HypA/HybF involved in hydrogenase expression
MFRRALVWCLLLLPLLSGLVTAELEARAGGGGGYSGGSGYGGGGGGGGDGIGILIYLLIRLVLFLWIEGGPVGKVLSVVIVIGAGFGFWKYKKKQESEQEKSNIRGRLLHGRSQIRAQSQGIALIKQHDPNFSRILFTDFAHLVYVKLHESRGGLARRNDSEFAVSPYLSERLREQVKNSKVEITEVVVGTLRFARVWATQNHMHINVMYRANVVQGGQRLFLEQRLHFRRPKSVTTRSPEKVLDLGCPNCGSPEEPGLDGRCPSCGSLTGRGDMDWQVQTMTTLKREPVGPPVGHDGGMEVGTDLPTVYQPNLAAAKRELVMRDPNFDWQRFTTRVKHMFMEIQQGWSDVDESRLRPYETDTLFDAHRFWLERFRETGIRSMLKDIRIMRIEVAKIEHDAYYDAITVRIFASMKDYKVDSSGNVISGSKTKDRTFSEYWTLVRRSDVDVFKRSGDPRNCPNCGAPLDRVNRAGVCEYCNSKLVSGVFDWVLALIEQDEEYAG